MADPFIMIVHVIGSLSISVTNIRLTYLRQLPPAAAEIVTPRAKGKSDEPIERKFSLARFRFTLEDRARGIAARVELNERGR